MSNQMAKVLTFGVSGVNGFPVQTEVFCVDGMPMMEIIGLPDTAVRESKNRINAAIISSGVKLPVSRVIYLMKTSQLESPVRFDVIEIRPDSVRHIPDAFQPGSMFYR